MAIAHSIRIPLDALVTLSERGHHEAPGWIINRSGPFRVIDTKNARPEGAGLTQLVALAAPDGHQFRSGDGAPLYLPGIWFKLFESA